MLQIFILLGQLLVRSDFFMESQAKNMTALLYSYACIISSMSNLCLFAGISLYHLSISEEIFGSEKIWYVLSSLNCRASVQMSRVREDSSAGSLPASHHRAPSFPWVCLYFPFFKKLKCTWYTIWCQFKVYSIVIHFLCILFADSIPL